MNRAFKKCYADGLVCLGIFRVWLHDKKLGGFSSALFLWIMLMTEGGGGGPDDRQTWWETKEGVGGEILAFRKAEGTGRVENEGNGFRC